MKPWGIAMDSDVTTFLMQANTAGYDPAVDYDAKIAPERTAAFLVFLYVERIIALPTVRRQVAQICDSDLRALHQGFELVHLEEPHLEQSAVTIRARELGQYHQGGKREEEDCQIVAEAELAGAGSLLTFDADLRKRLVSHARLPLLSPSDFWRTLAVTRGTQPCRNPQRSHPLHFATWWRW